MPQLMVFSSIKTNQAYQLLEEKVLLKLDWAKNQKPKSSLKKTIAFAIEGSSNSDTDKIMARMDAMTMKWMLSIKNSNLQSGRPSGSLPSNTQPKPKGSSSKPYQPPDDEDDEPTPQPKPKNPKPAKETPISKPYKPKIPYPQCLRKEKMEAQYEKFIDMIRAVRINVPLVDVLARMPNYGKFLKELVINKHKIEQNLTDVGASINLMPYSLYAKLSLETLKPTKMSVGLADRSFQYPVGITKNMLVEVGKFTFPVDFVTLEMEEDSKVPLILGRTFLHTTDSVIRVKQKQLNLEVGTE
ncbi:reverse transcriptase domain-containing protein [Tanacetum coccineum]